MFAASVSAAVSGDLTGHKLLVTSVRTDDTEIFLIDPDPAMPRT